MATQTYDNCKISSIYSASVVDVSGYVAIDVSIETAGKCADLS